MEPRVDELTADDLSWAWPDAPQDRLPVVVPIRADADFPKSWRVLDDVQLLDVPDPAWTIQGVLQSRSVGAIYAPPGAGKTTLLAGMLVAIATGRDWFGHPVLEPGGSLYVAAEDLSGFKVRTKSAKRAARLPLDQPIGVYTFPETIDLRDVTAVHRFIAFVRATVWPIPLVTIAIDTYAASVAGAAENSSEDTTVAMTHAQQIRDALNVSVILIHHTNASGNRERGHSAMRGSADFMISMTPADDVITVEASKQRNGESGKQLFKLKMVPLQDGDGCVLRLAEDVLASLKMTPAQAKIYGVLRDSFGADGATKAEWARCCGDVAERTFYHASTKLVEHGYVKAVGTHFRITGQVPK